MLLLFVFLVLAWFGLVGWLIFVCLFIPVLFVYFAILWIKPSAMHVLGKCYTAPPALVWVGGGGWLFKGSHVSQA